MSLIRPPCTAHRKINHSVREAKLRQRNVRTASSVRRSAACGERVVAEFNVKNEIINTAHGVLRQRARGRPQMNSPRHKQQSLDRAECVQQMAREYATRRGCVFGWGWIIIGNNIYTHITYIHFSESAHRHTPQASYASETCRRTKFVEIHLKKFIRTGGDDADDADDDDDGDRQ